MQLLAASIAGAEAHESSKWVLENEELIRKLILCAEKTVDLVLKRNFG